MTHVPRHSIRKSQFDDGLPQAVAWSPDGQSIAIGDTRGQVELRTKDGQHQWHKWGHEGYVQSLSWSPDGKRVASASLDHHLRIWEAETGRSLFNCQYQDGGSVSWSPDGQYLAYSTYTGIHLMEAVQGHHVTEIEEFAPVSITWSPDGEWLACGEYWGNRVLLWNYRRGLRQQHFTVRTGPVWSVCWSPDGQHLAAGAKDGSIRIWDVHSGLCRCEWHGYQQPVRALRWSPLNACLACGFEDGTLLLWHPQKPDALISLVHHGDVIWSLDFSPDGQYLVSAANDGAVCRWELPMHMLLSAPAPIYVTLDAYIVRQAATVGRRPTRDFQSEWIPHLPGSDDQSLGVLKVSPKVLETNTWPSMDFFPDGQTLAVGFNIKVLGCWDLASGEALWKERTSSVSSTNDLEVSPDGRWLATASVIGTVCLWDAHSGKLLREFETNLEHYYSGAQRVRWSPDNERLVTVPFLVSDKLVRIWNVHNGTCAFSCEGHQALPRAVDWSPKGHLVASGDDHGELRLWDANTGECVHHVSLHSAPLWDLRWSPDGESLLVGFGNGKVLLWDVHNQTPSFWCQGHESGVCTVAWSPDGLWMVTGSRGKDCTIRIWAAHDGRELNQFGYEEYACYQVTWSTNGNYLAASFNDGTLRFWDARRLLQSAPHENEGLPSFSRLRESEALARAWSQMFRLRIHPPLSLLRDLLALLGKPSTRPLQNEEVLERLRRETGVSGMMRLGWPYEARVGLAALLLHSIAFEEWQPPPSTTPAQLRNALAQALHGDPIAAKPATPPSSLLHKAAQTVDDRMLGLLEMLGAEAVANDPGLPLRLLPRIKQLPALGIETRRLLGVPLRLKHSTGHTLGRSSGMERAQVGGVEMGSMRTDWGALLPSQLALPPKLLAYRNLRGELLLRSYEMGEPPHLHPTVLVLDVSPPVFGPVESITRLAAFMVARALQQSSLACLLVTTVPDNDEQVKVFPLIRPIDLIEIWTQRTLALAKVKTTLHLAHALAASLRDGSGLEPILLILSHAWFGSEEEITPLSNVRGLFVQYPGYSMRPALADICERCQSISIDQGEQLPRLLEQLIG